MALVVIKSLRPQTKTHRGRGPKFKGKKNKLKSGESIPRRSGRNSHVATPSSLVTCPAYILLKWLHLRSTTQLPLVVLLLFVVVLVVALP